MLLHIVTLYFLYRNAKFRYSLLVQISLLTMFRWNLHLGATLLSKKAGAFSK
jgi:hypothetical protein